jgi:hypothetical protein
MNQNIEIIPTSIPEEISRTTFSHDSIFNITSIYNILINPTYRADIINTSSRQIILAVIQSIKKLNNLLSIRRVLLICINKFFPIGITNRSVCKYYCAYIN